MRTAKDAGGARLYESAEFLTAQQIADYFSRLVAKRNTDENTQMTTKKKIASLENKTHPAATDERESCDQRFNSEPPSNRVGRI